MAWFRTKLRFPPSVSRKSEMAKDANLQLQRLNLEQEVADLRNILDREERLSQILQHEILGDVTSHCQSYIFFPQEIKKVLAEVSMVEMEITRLENEKINLQINLHQEKEITRTYRSKIMKLENSDRIEKRKEKNLSEDTRSGKDYRRNCYSCSVKYENPNSDPDVRKNKKEIESHENVKNQSEILRSNPPRPEVVVVDSKIDTRSKHKASSNSISSIQACPKSLNPNKLSEKTLKCLICIFTRLVRNSRSADIETPRKTSRLNLRSFASSTERDSLFKSRRTQDPYGVLGIQDSLVRNIGAYKNYMVFTADLWDVDGISTALPLFKKLRNLLNRLSMADLRSLNHNQKLAFWINTYNACILHGLLQLGLPSSPKKMMALRNKASLIIGENEVTASMIEHSILRQPLDSNKVLWKTKLDGKSESFLPESYGLERAEPNIIFALCCGSQSSPAVRVFTAEGVSTELRKAKLEYLQASIVVTGSKRILLPELLFSNMFYYARDETSLAKWVCDQLPTSGTLRKSMADSLRTQDHSKTWNAVGVLSHEFKFQCILAT